MQENAVPVYASDLCFDHILRNVSCCYELHFLVAAKAIELVLPALNGKFIQLDPELTHTSETCVNSIELSILDCVRYDITVAMAMT